MKRYIAAVVLLLATSGFVTEVLKLQRRERDLADFTPEMQVEFERLSELIRHFSPEKRVEAIRGFKAFGSLEATPLLVEALRDANSDVKTAAIGALEQLDYRIGAAGCANLLRLTRDGNAEVRARAERALIQLCNWRAVPLMLEEAQREDCKNQSFLLALLEHCTGHTIPGPKVPEPATQDSPPAPAERPDEAYLLNAWREWFKRYKEKTPVDWLVDDLKAAAPESRARAAELLGKLRDERARPCLLDALDDDDENVRRGVLRALVSLRAAEAVPRISALYLEAEGTLAQKCEKALKRLAGPGHIEALVAGLAEASEKKRSVYCRFLKIASGRRMPAGESALSYWQKYAARVRGLPPLEIYALGLEDGDPGNRLEAAGRLKRFGEAAVEYLLKALDDESQSVREQAVKSLRAATFHYEGYRSEGPSEERSKAGERWRSWWESRKGKETVKRLIAQLRDRRDVRNRVEAAIGLKKMDAWESVPHLIEALAEESEGLRYYAACALRGITGRSFGFVSNAPVERRNDAIAQWRSWWTSAREMDKERALIATIRDIAVNKAAKIRAIKALAEMHSERAAIPLANLLDGKSFVVSSVAEEALERITQKSFFHSVQRTDADEVSPRAIWLRYLTDPQKD